MQDIQNRLAAVPDARRRIIAIFVGSVLLPSVALSVFSFNAIPKQAENLKLGLLRRAEQLLFYAEQDLEKAARRKALEAARAIGPEQLLDGRPREIRAALAAAGLGAVEFESLRLEAWSSSRVARQGARPAAAEMRALDQALNELPLRPARRGTDAVPLTTRGGEELGVVRFRLASGYARKSLLPEFFERGFVDPQNAWVIRVSEPSGAVLYENAPTRSAEDFEVRRVLAAPSFEGLTLQLRYRDRSIEEAVHREAVARTVLICFIDLMLLAGFSLVFSNVRRELRLSQLKSDFVANVSHELKTPLALIRLFAETLELGRVPNQEKAGQYHRIINKETRRLTQLINNILDFSRIEAGRKEYRFVRGDVADVVREVVESYRFSIEQQGGSLEVEIAEDLPELSIDPEALSHALINLVNNAIKYSPQEKRIRIRARCERERILVSVSDRGIGIPHAEHRRIFEKFYRAESSVVHTTKGSGLGLALVRHVVEAHGGKVDVESAPGEGSTFTVALPLDAATVRRGRERVPSHGTMAARPADSPPAEGAFPPEDAPFRERP